MDSVRTNCSPTASAAGVRNWAARTSSPTTLSRERYSRVSVPAGAAERPMLAMRYVTDTRCWGTAFVGPSIACTTMSGRSVSLTTIVSTPGANPVAEAVSTTDLLPSATPSATVMRGTSTEDLPEGNVTLACTRASLVRLLESTTTMLLVVGVLREIVSSVAGLRPSGTRRCAATNDNVGPSSSRTVSVAGRAVPSRCPVPAAST